MQIQTITKSGYPRTVKHGHTSKIHGSTRTYKSWEDMKKRCFNPNCKLFKYYGARGITVCEKWLKFIGFLEDMGECPPGLTIERKNNDGNYEKDNCKWATMDEQSKNKRRRSDSKMLTCWGETKHITEWQKDPRVVPLSLTGLFDRLNREKLSVEEAFTRTPRYKR